jgi:hypothetical protein
MKLTIEVDDEKTKDLLEFLKGIQAEPILYPAFPELPYNPIPDFTGSIPGYYNPCENCSNKNKGPCHCALPAMTNPIYC